MGVLAVSLLRGDPVPLPSRLPSLITLFLINCLKSAGKFLSCTDIVHLHYRMVVFAVTWPSQIVIVFCLISDLLNRDLTSCHFYFSLQGSGLPGLAVSICSIKQFGFII